MKVFRFASILRRTSERGLFLASLLSTSLCLSACGDDSSGSPEDDGGTGADAGWWVELTGELAGGRYEGTVSVFAGPNLSAQGNGSFNATIDWPDTIGETGTFGLSSLMVRDEEDTFLCGNESVQATVNANDPYDIDFAGDVRCWPSDAVGEGDGELTTLTGHVLEP